ncbi:hypothetical protein SteCoe_25773 [Stentor coeruleus]|uniref:Uncharacterized protein n=1 Tax=Stentor coeruleus TaxID=5963 RepID=A0A1R2BEG7_9CILI|nr:hypothetical protein SteCoe_25773 [Stentor coeruleus]
MISFSDIFSGPATVRWKRTSMSSSRNSFSIASTRRIRQMVSSQNASRFVNLLDASTNDTARVSKGEDLKEVSSQLGFLRKHYDINKTINSLRVKTANFKAFDLQSVQENIQRLSQTSDKSQNRVKILEKEIEDMKKQQEASELDTLVYKQILERMRQTRIHLDMKNLKLNKYLKTHEQHLSEEFNKQRRVREARIQTKLAVKNLEKFISRETREKTDELQFIEKDVKQKKESNMKREERLRRQVEISEAAADEDRNLRAMQLREGLLLHMLWYLWLQKRLRTDMQKFSKLEAAFDNVKKATGMHQPEEIIEKVLTHESGFTEILENINYTRTRILEYNAKNREMEEKLSMLNMIKTENINPAKTLELEVNKKTREIEYDKERMIKVLGVYKNVVNWAKKNNSAFGLYLEPPPVMPKHRRPTYKESKGELLGRITELKVKILRILSPFRQNKNLVLKVESDVRVGIEKAYEASNKFKGHILDEDSDQNIIKSLVSFGEASDNSIRKVNIKGKA